MIWLHHLNYIAYAALLVIGLHAVIARPSLVKKVIGLGVLQTAVFLLFISMAAVEGGRPPILPHDGEPVPGATYANPIPQVLILTAIVVAVSTMSLALALCVRIHQEWGTTDANEIRERSEP